MCKTESILLLLLCAGCSVSTLDRTETERSLTSVGLEESCPVGEERVRARRLNPVEEGPCWGSIESMPLCVEQARHYPYKDGCIVEAATGVLMNTIFRPLDSDDYRGCSAKEFSSWYNAPLCDVSE